MLGPGFGHKLICLRYKEQDNELKNVPVLIQHTLGARVSRNEWEHFRNILKSRSILLHCNPTDTFMEHLECVAKMKLKCAQW